MDTARSSIRLPISTSALPVEPLDDQRENAIVSLRRIHDTLGGPEFIADEIELSMVCSPETTSRPDLCDLRDRRGPAERERLDIPLSDRDCLTSPRIS